MDLSLSNLIDFIPSISYLCIGCEFRRALKQGGVVAAILILPIQVVIQTGDVIQTNFVKKHLIYDQ